MAAALKRTKPLRINPYAGPKLDCWPAQTDTNTVWLPLMTDKTSLTMLVNGSTGEVLAALPIDPC